MEIAVTRMANGTQDVRGEAADVFVDAYFKELSTLSKDKARWKAALLHAFRGEACFVAGLNGKVVGILACSDARLRGMHVDKRELRKELGFLKRSLAYFALSGELNKPLTYPEDTTYIECVGTSEEARGKGVCTALFRHVMESLPYRHYILEVLDTNENAIRLYKKLGFTEFGRKKEAFAKMKGFKERIYMKWSKP